MKVELPKKKKRDNFTEAQFQSKVTAWLKINAWGSFPYELKISQGGTINFKAFQPQQIPALYRARTGIQHHKMTDASIGTKPYDAFVFKKSLAYVGLLFNAKTNHKVCYFIDIIDIVKLINNGDKSISEEVAIKVATTIGQLK